MRKKILVADDSITVLKVVEMAFSASAYDVICVKDGKEALEKFEEDKPDIVLADIIMPEMDGYSLCRAIKSMPDHSHIPVLLLSGAFEPFDREKADSSAADGIVTKPFESKILVDRVEKLLNPPPKQEIRQEEAVEEAHQATSLASEGRDRARDIEDFPVDLDDALEIPDHASMEQAEFQEEERIERSSASTPHPMREGEDAGGLTGEETELSASESPSILLTDKERELVTKKLVRMISSDDTLKQIIRETISEIAERIIRERIKELEESASE